MRDEDLIGITEFGITIQEHKPIKRISCEVLYTIQDGDHVPSWFVCFQISNICSIRGMITHSFYNFDTVTT